MVSRSEVELCYRFVLGREPESTDVVAELARSCQTTAEVRTAMLNSAEFRSGLSAAAVTPMKPLGWPPSAVDVAVPPDALQQMLGRVERSWEDMGGSEPFWSVLTADQFLSANLDANKAAFYESGRDAVALLSAATARAGIGDLSDGAVCLEYGCGVGRLTVWLARQFRSVIACDISQPHLDHTGRALAERGIGNVELRRVPTVQAIEALPSFDVFVSLIVLQHNPPPVAAHILEAVLRRLNPGGLAYFQVPTYSLGYSFDARQYLANEEQPGMEMHVIPQHDLFALFARCGCQVLEVREDSWTGSPLSVSNTFLLRKPAILRTDP